jgi:hypothetical protein
LKVGDKVKFKLHETEQVGSVLKIYEKEGWKGYANVMLENKHKIEIPVTFLEVISESR